MSDSLIFPASASVAPAVFAVRARSEPCHVSLSNQECPNALHTGQIDYSEGAAGPGAHYDAAVSFLDLNAEESVTA